MDGFVVLVAIRKGRSRFTCRSKAWGAGRRHTGRLQAERGGARSVPCTTGRKWYGPYRALSPAGSRDPLPRVGPLGLMKGNRRISRSIVTMDVGVRAPRRDREAGEFARQTRIRREMTAVRRIADAPRAPAGSCRGPPGPDESAELDTRARFGHQTPGRADRAPRACRTPATGATRADGESVPRTRGMSPRCRARSSSRPILAGASADARKVTEADPAEARAGVRRRPTVPAHERHAGPDVAPRGAGHSLRDGDSGTVCPVGRPVTGHAVNHRAGPCPLITRRAP